jgi:hypothetical protein
MSVEEIAELLPQTVRDLVYALADIRTLSSGPASKRNNETIKQIADNALTRLEETVQEME